MCGCFFVHGNRMLAERAFYCFIFITGSIGVFRVVRKTRQLEQEEKSCG